jgi:hypothetical protein
VGLAKFQQSLDAPLTVTASKFFDLEQLNGRILESLLEPMERIILDSLSGVRSTVKSAPLPGLVIFVV